MRVLRTIKEWYAILVNPKAAFAKLHKKRLESVMIDYLKLLLLVAIISGLIVFFFNAFRALYYDLLFNIDINYWYLANYSMGKAIGVLTFYLYAGTFGFFLLSLVINIFTKVKYVQLLMILFYSLAPLLLFGWILPASVALFIWSIVLFVEGIKIFEKSSKNIKGTIRQRE